MRADQVIIRPVLSEKTNALREENKYVFQVDARVNKIQVMDAVRELFNVHPVRCNVSTVKSKPRRVRYKAGRTATWKKAVVKLAPGETIEVFEGA